MKIRNILIYIMIILIMAGCSSPRTYYRIKRSEQAETVYNIEQIINRYPQNQAHWGILVQNEVGDTLAAYNSERLFIPASTMKLITAAAAWKMLSPDYRFPTYIGYDGFRHNNILFGNLIVSGSGDPTLESRHWRDVREVFGGWADSLQKYGIREIRGDVIGNDDLFEEQHLGSGWAWDDLSFPFSAEFGALMADNSLAEITIHIPADSSEELVWEDNLPFKYLDYENCITLEDSVKTRLHARRLPGSNTIRLFGKAAYGHEAVHKTVTTANPTLYYAELLKSVLIEKGIIISGWARDIDDLEQKPEGINSIFTFYSPELKYIIRQFLQDSNNQSGEALLRHIAWKETGKGSFENGKLVVEVILEDIDVSMLDYRFQDGCGLSRYNLISPSVLNKVLLYMQDCEGWQECLSQPGNGTLQERLPEFSGRLYAKSGSMSNINCLSGYLYNKKGRKLIFTIMINNYNNPQNSSDLIDELIRIIAG